MELVEDGVRIDEYCQKKNLALEARLQLFQTVCAAVTFAHTRSIIHRDLKSENILVDQHGEPKLLDFGLAKLLTDEEVMPSFTKSAIAPLWIGTEGSMAPEVRDGKPPTRVSDVYSLGTILDSTQKNLNGSDPLGQVIKQATAKIPADRYQSVGELSEALANLFVLPQGGDVRRGQTRVLDLQKYLRLSQVLRDEFGRAYTVV